MEQMTTLQRDTVCVGTMLNSMKTLTVYKHSDVNAFAELSGASVYSRKTQITRFKKALNRAYELGLCERKFINNCYLFDKKS